MVSIYWEVLFIWDILLKDYNPTKEKYVCREIFVSGVFLLLWYHKH